MAQFNLTKSKQCFGAHVTSSRGRKGIRIFTPDKVQLRENVIRSGQRKLALQLADARSFKPVPRFGFFRRMEARLHRFGRKAARRICRARRFSRFNAQTFVERHDQQITGPVWSICRTLDFIGASARS